eukprot:1257335-Rhodomonas_salina.1
MCIALIHLRGWDLAVAVGRSDVHELPERLHLEPPQHLRVLPAPRQLVSTALLLVGIGICIPFWGTR